MENEEFVSYCGVVQPDNSVHRCVGFIKAASVVRVEMVYEEDRDYSRYTPVLGVIPNAAFFIAYGTKGPGMLLNTRMGRPRILDQFQMPESMRASEYRLWWKLHTRAYEYFDSGISRSDVLHEIIVCDIEHKETRKLANAFTHQMTGMSVVELIAHMEKEEARFGEHTTLPICATAPKFMYEYPF